MLYAVCFLIIVILFAPVLVTIPFSFTSIRYFTVPIPGFSTQWYEKMATGHWMQDFLRSLGIATVTAVLATVLGVMAASAVCKLKFKGKRIFMGLMISPILLPLIITAVTVYSVYANLHWVNTIHGLVLGHTLTAFPLVFVSVTSVMGSLDENQELAGLSLGSTPIGVFFKITLPSILPAVLSGTLLAFVTSLDEIAISLFIAGASTQTLPLLMWEAMRSDVDPTIAAVSTVLICIALTLFTVRRVFEKIQKRRMGTRSEE